MTLAINIFLLFEKTATADVELQYTFVLAKVFLALLT